MQMQTPFDLLINMHNLLKISKYTFDIFCIDVKNAPMYATSSLIDILSHS